MTEQEAIRVLDRVSRWIDMFPVPTDGATVMMGHVRDVQAFLATIAPAAAPEPRVTEQANERARVYQEDDAFTEWWNRVQACPEHNLMTENAARATWHERARRAALTRQAAPEAPALTADERVLALSWFKVYRGHEFIMPEHQDLADKLAAPAPATQQAGAAAEPVPLFWYRPIGNDGLYEGPVHNNSVGGKMLRDEQPGQWIPLYAMPSTPAATQQAGAAVAWIATDLDGRAGVGFTKEEAKRQAGEGCTEFIPLFDLGDFAATTASASDALDWPHAPGRPELDRAPAPSREAALNDTDQTPYMIVFDDADRPPEMVIGGKRARYRYEQISMAWNAHLFVKIDSNSRDEPRPSAGQAAHAGADTERDAERWRAFVGSARIKPQGSAGLGEPQPNHYAHMGLEIWTTYDRNYPQEMLDRMDISTALGREWLTKYADIAIEAQRAAIAASAAPQSPTEEA